MSTRSGTRSKLAVTFSVPKFAARPLRLYTATEKASVRSSRKGSGRTSTAPAGLVRRAVDFRDGRLPELLFRYRARNWPQTLDPGERARWDDYRRRRLTRDEGLSEYTFDGYFAEIAALRAAHAGDGGKLALLDRIEQWGRDLQGGL